jgi:heme-degrading monooxygenase HmoA
MVLERVEMPSARGKEISFESAFATAGPLLRSAKGCRGVRLARGVENPSGYLLLIDWDSLDAHVAFTGTAEFARFRELAGPYFANKPAMEHFEPIDPAYADREGY